MSDNSESLLKNITHNIRDSISEGRFRCLPSLLRRILKDTFADCVGLAVSGRTNRRVDIVRFELRSGDSEPPALRNAVAGLLEDPDEKADWRYSKIVSAKGEKVDSLFLQRVIPPAYLNRQSGDSYWLFLWKPKLFSDGCTGAEGFQLLHNWMHLVNDWFAWKQLQLVYQKEAVEEIANENHSDIVVLNRRLTRVRRKIARRLVRPIIPRQLLQLILLLPLNKPETISYVEWGDFWNAWTAKFGKLTKPCHLDDSKATVCLGCSGITGCIQGDSLADVGNVMVHLILWRTRFWRGLSGARLREPEVRSLIYKACESLCEAKNFLGRDYEDGTTAPLFSERENLLSERKLLRQFVALAIGDALADYQRDKDGWEPTENDLEFLAKLAGLASVLLVNGDWTPEAINNLIRVMADYGHLKLGIPGWLDLARHLRHTLRGEGALHTLKKFYRDHFFHTIEVCLMGFLFLRSHPGKLSEGDMRKRLMGLKAGKRGSKAVGGSPAPSAHTIADEKLLLANWWLAALAHDTAYGIEILQGTLDLLDYFKNRKEVEDFTKAVKAEVKKLSQGIAEGKTMVTTPGSTAAPAEAQERTVLPELKGDPLLDKGDHGLITASHLAAVLGKHGSQWLEKYEPAVRAVAFHNTKTPVVDGRRDPVAALLILCDTLQDWGRSSLGHDRSPTVVLSRLVSSAPPPPDEQFGPAQRFDFSLKVESRPGGKSSALLWKTPGTLRMTLDYPARMQKDQRIFFTWMDAVFNFQRVDFSSWGVDFHARYRIPTPEPGDIKPGQTVDKFHEFARMVRQQEAGFLLPFVEAAQSNLPGQTVKHYAENAVPDLGTGEYALAPNGWEVVELNLGGLHECLKRGEPLMGRSLPECQNVMSDFFGKPGSKDGDDPPQRPPV